MPPSPEELKSSLGDNTSGLMHMPAWLKKMSPQHLWATGTIFILFGLFVIGLTFIFEAIDLFDSTLALGFVGVSIGLISLGFGSISLGFSKESGERMQAIANMEFREKIAIMAYHMSKLQTMEEAQDTLDAWRTLQDLRAALELEKWVNNESLRQEFKTSLKRLVEIAKGTEHYYVYEGLRKLEKEVAGSDSS